jgi:integrase
MSERQKPKRSRPNRRPKELGILTDREIRRLLVGCEEFTRYPTRNKAIVLLACEAGLTIREISRLWRGHIVDPTDAADARIEVYRSGAKNLLNRSIPMPRGTRLFRAVYALLREVPGVPSDPLILSERAMRGEAAPDEDRYMRPTSIGYLFYRLYLKTGVKGSSHTARESFIVRAGRAVKQTKGSLRDVQYLAGHSSLTSTQNYIELDEEAQKIVMRSLFPEIPDLIDEG